MHCARGRAAGRAAPPAARGRASYTSFIRGGQGSGFMGRKLPMRLVYTGPVECPVLKASRLPDWRPPQGWFVAAALLKFCSRPERNFR